MQNLYIAAEQIRVARPDTVRSIEQLAVGNVVVKFITYLDPDGIINKHLSRVAIVHGPPCRITDGEIINKSAINGKYMRAERLPALTLDEMKMTEPDLLSVGHLGIEGVDKLAPHLAINTGLLAVREEVSPDGIDLEVGPGLYVDGTNSLQALFHDNYMAIALDSDPRLIDRLPQSWQ